MRSKSKCLATVLLATAVAVSSIQTGSVTLYAMENQEPLLSDGVVAESDL